MRCLKKSVSACASMCECVCVCMCCSFRRPTTFPDPLHSHANVMHDLSSYNDAAVIITEV